MKKIILSIQSLKIPPNFTKWLIVGFSSLILDVYVFKLVFDRTEKVLLSNFLAALSSTVFNYLMHYFWTFSSLTKHRESLLRYILNICVIWIVGTGLIKTLIVIGSTPLLAKLIAMALVLPVNYFSLKIFVYRAR